MLRVLWCGSVAERSYYNLECPSFWPSVCLSGESARSIGRCWQCAVEWRAAGALVVLGVVSRCGYYAAELMLGR
eukprot:COSAG02_NODE_1301_length_13367_cov_14.080570_1_plen_74_part_00